MDDEPVESPLIPAATVVLLRDGIDGVEVLMLRRNSKLDFAGGMWVFPGGRIDPGDHIETGSDPGSGASLLADARRAATREAREEAGLDIDVDALIWFSHWTPPVQSPRRFSTWFFVARAPAGEVAIDGGEIHDHGWMTPIDARRRRDRLEIELSPPTWITLSQLADFATVDETLAALNDAAPTHFATRIAVVQDGVVALYAGDAGYESNDVDAPGARHRLWMMNDRWRYENDGEASA